MLCFEIPKYPITRPIIHGEFLKLILVFLKKEMEKKSKEVIRIKFLLILNNLIQKKKKSNKLMPIASKSKTEQRQSGAESSIDHCICNLSTQQTCGWTHGGRSFRLYFKVEKEYSICYFHKFSFVVGTGGWVTPQPDQELIFHYFIIVMVSYYL